MAGARRVAKVNESKANKSPSVGILAGANCVKDPNEAAKESRSPSPRVLAALSRSTGLTASCIGLIIYFRFGLTRSTPEGSADFQPNNGICIPKTKENQKKNK